ncbi:MAG: DNA glycosylase AlkZ-like family protein [Sciscionella sp.]
MKITREQVLAYRIGEQGLHRSASAPRQLGILDLGVQDTANATARLAMAARLSRPADTLDGLTLIWSYRGAPHLHRAADVTALADALWPVSEIDALARMAWQRSGFHSTGMTAIEAISLVARAFRDQVTAPASKGAASAALTRAIPDGLSYWCRGCQSTHILEQLMRLAALPAGVALGTDRYPATLAPIKHWRGIPTEQRGLARVINNYLRFLGPATPKEVAGFLSSTTKELLPHWPAGLSEVELDGKKAWLPSDALPTLRKPREPPRVRLLPALDPYLQARDRERLVPDKAARKQLWRILGNPGALLAEGEIAGTWRMKSLKTRLELSVTPFVPLPATIERAVNAEAETIAAVRGVPEVSVRFA